MADWLRTFIEVVVLATGGVNLYASYRTLQLKAEILKEVHQGFVPREVWDVEKRSIKDNLDHLWRRVFNGSALIKEKE